MVELRDFVKETNLNGYSSGGTIDRDYAENVWSLSFYIPLAIAFKKPQVHGNMAWSIMIQCNNRIHFYVSGERLKSLINKGRTGIVIST